jgi:VWFA-related protein
MRGQTESATPPAVPPAASATPPAATVEAPAAPGVTQSQSAAQVATLRAFSNLVVIDVVVTDSNKSPVHGLKQSDFTLSENGKEQTIRHFEEHKPGPARSIALAPKLPAGLFSNISATPANGPVNVLLLDYLNTPLTSQPYARKQLLDYMDKAPAGTRIAIFGLTERLEMLQGFTSDMAVLKSALSMTKGSSRVSDLLSDPVNGSLQGDTSISDALANDPTAVAGMLTQDMINDVNRFEALTTSFQQQLRAEYTLHAFDELARYLVGIPGRKNVIWFSGGFPLDVEPDFTEINGNDAVVRNDDEIRKTDNLLTRAQIAVYPVDSQGLQTDPTYSVANSLGDAGANGTASMGFLNQLAQNHEAMFAMAEDTGGEAFVNTNGLTQAVGKAIEEGSNYYTLSYTPANVQWDERFRTVKVKVDNPNAKNLSYRNGYYAIDPNDRNRLNASGAATALSAPTTMATAMMHGGPDPAEILFKVRIRPASTPPGEALAPDNFSNPDKKVNVEGPFKEFGVDLVPDPKAVNCNLDANGNHHCALEIYTYIYDRDGKLLVTTGHRIFRLLTPADYNTLLTGGMAFHQEISVPVKGEHYLRTAIHDLVSDRVGAVEIPVAQVAKLDPLKEPPVASNTAPAAAAPAATPAGPTPAAPALQPVAPAGGAATP